jgi:hypothetical protein
MLTCPEVATGGPWVKTFKCRRCGVTTRPCPPNEPRDKFLADYPECSAIPDNATFARQVGIEQERARCVRIVEEFLGQYGEDLFPTPPKSHRDGAALGTAVSIDRYSAAALRAVLPRIIAKIKEAGE